MTTFREVANKGVRANLKKMQTLLSVGIVLSLTIPAAAAERSRGASTDRNVSRTSGASSDIVELDGTVRVEEIAPGVGRVEVNGVVMTVRQDGAITAADVIAEHGSIANYLFASEIASQPAARAADGSLLIANGMVPFLSDALGSNYPSPVATTVDSYKEQMTWLSMEVRGQEIVNFADGVVMPGQLQAVPMSTGPMVIGPEGEAHANGAVYFDR